MSEENVEIARRGWEAFNRRDYSFIAEQLHESFEWHPAQSPGGMERNVYRGVQEYLTRIEEELPRTWAEFQVRDLTLRDVGDNRLVTLGRLHARGRASGAEVDVPFAQVWTLQDGKLLCAVGYLTHAEALEAAGLQE